MFEIRPDVLGLVDLLERRDGLLEGPPALDGVGQELGAGGLERPAEILGDGDRGAAQHLGVELVGAAHDVALVLQKQGNELVLVDRVAVALGLLDERLVRAFLPVDEGSVDVERHEGDVFGERHESRHCASKRPSGARR